MAKTTANTISRIDQFIGDTSTDSVSQADRFRAISVATQELLHEFGFDMTNKTLTIDYFDTINYYDISSDAPTFTEPADLRVTTEDGHVLPFTRKTPREMATEVNIPEDYAFGIERRDAKTFLAISYPSQYDAVALHNADSLTANGTWSADTSTSDATNLTADTNEFRQGSGSLNFDIDVSQSGNDRATISNSDMTAVDLTTHEDLSSFICDIYIPDVTDFTGITVYWGSDSSSYWSGSATTDVFGATWLDGWNRAKVDWADTTKTSTPTVSATDYLRLDFDYAVGQGDDTDFRVDNILMVRPEKLKFYYNSWIVGTNTGGTDITEFGATNDIPFYSGQYDSVDNYVAMRAAAILSQQMGLRDDADELNRDANLEKTKLSRLFPTHRITETKSFKVKSLNW